MLFVIAIAVHVLAVVHWIGGVALVTTVILPTARRMDTVEDRLRIFDLVESRFAPQARISVLVVGITGLYMLNHLDLWRSMLAARGWWLDSMVILWTIFALMLFVVEPLFLHSWFIRSVHTDPEAAFRRMELLHWVLLILSLLTIGAAVAGTNGLSIS
ncbi:hypothetical protein [Candidatus Binatus sp.]|uniref:hypothetical protein n=1 Tax=Candidatus Binatus sp. TaxID=2811406 RepID=UPI002F94A288